MFVKNAIWWLGKRLLGDEKQSGFTKHLLMPLLLLASVLSIWIQIKDYIHRCTTNEKLFVIPDDVKSKARKTKYILVLDLD